MFLILMITMITVTNCLEPKQDNKIDEEITKVITKYISKIPDVEPQYVIHEGLSKVITRYFKEKITTFPLYKISLKLDRNPVKIPWTLAEPNSMAEPATAANTGNEEKGRTYKFVPDVKKE